MAFRKQKPIKPEPIYSDLSTNFSLNAMTGDVVRLTEMDAVKRAIKNLIMTNKYERLLDPRFGAGINALLFEPMTPLVTITIRDTIETSISTYEPRADLKTVDVVPDYDGQTYYVDIVFSLRNTNQTGTVQFLIDRIR
jgi:phage baseplate assembly protein W